MEGNNDEEKVGMKRTKDETQYEEGTTNPSKITKKDTTSPRVHATRVQLSTQQQKVIDLVLRGISIFLTGNAGTGKSVVLTELIWKLIKAKKQIAVTASTGIAALNLPFGKTLHSWVGCGINPMTKETAPRFASKLSEENQFTSTQVLIIDEISMVSNEFLDAIDIIAKISRGRSDLPFGGIQVIFCGDFLQLPPVIVKPAKGTFAFVGQSWKAAKLTCCCLTKQFRQGSDLEFVDLLNMVRKGKMTKEGLELLQKTTKTEFGDLKGVIPTILYSTRVEVDKENELELAKLKGEHRTYVAEDKSISLSALKMLEKSCIAPKALTLKVGAQVVLLKNIGGGLVNGSRGVVTGFDDDKTGYPMVKFVDHDNPVCMGPQVWEILGDSGDQLAMRQQIPFNLAWALTIHKSQGMTLDCVQTSLENCFAPGQAYVALSRCRSFAALKIIGLWRPWNIKADSIAVRFYEDLVEKISIEDI